MKEENLPIVDIHTAQLLKRTIILSGKSDLQLSELRNPRRCRYLFYTTKPR